MNYCKPEITSLASASFVIQATSGKDMGGHDSKNNGLVSSSAYEADE
jgi:hypothetical protein